MCQADDSSSGMFLTGSRRVSPHSSVYNSRSLRWSVWLRKTSSGPGPQSSQTATGVPAAVPTTRPRHDITLSITPF